MATDELVVSHLNLEAVIASDHRLALAAASEDEAQAHRNRAAAVVRLALNFPAQSNAAEQAAKARICDAQA